jgi:hypothetical protein
MVRVVYVWLLMCLRLLQTGVSTIYLWQDLSDHEPVPCGILQDDGHVTEGRTRLADIRERLTEGARYALSIWSSE